MGGFHLLLGHLPKKVGFAFRDIVFLEKIKKSLFPFYHTQKEEPGPDIWGIEYYFSLLDIVFFKNIQKEEPGPDIRP